MSDHSRSPTDGGARDPDDTTVVGPGAGLRLWPGLVLGDRYRVERLLGRGGMGEVWQAFDLKLCVEVALKTLSPLQVDAQRREWLRREVRTAREVMSPNVCRIYDLIEIQGQELVSMEYVDGETFTAYLRARGSPGLQKAADLAGQLLAGLQAIHDAELVHRDLKPDNVMVTRSGRVVLMDFGIARAVSDTHHGTIAGTPAYMAPEQARGEPVDARADVYAAAMVLADLVYCGGAAGEAQRRALLLGMRADPPQLPEGPWREVLLKGLAPSPSARHASARAFARALEEITLRAEGRDDRSPYPGLSAFTGADTRYFFGREAEVEALGKKLRRLHLLAVVGPSGVGKSSFLRAGLLPALPGDWACVLCAPGPSPFVALGQALAPQLAGDTEALRAYLRFAELDVAVSMFARWRRAHGGALLVVDQFEELFTQSPPDVQVRFAELLGRLPLEADVRVLLSLRDDFLFHCHDHPGLRPLFTELTPLAPLRGADLRRALVQPALACGFRFESEGLVERMAAEVEGERGALPLLAFTAARLWEQRDRARGLLTAEAYEAVGGVAGSLAQHAEATLERIGGERQDLVRELFRNLVTAQGTRASRERYELLSVFADRQAAAEVLAQLIDARLLTTYEVTDPHDAQVRAHRVEVVHESLLTHWPRLVRWQTQDADGAQLRDQLRQAAQLWAEKGRPDDLLWTGTVYQEFSLWRERYPGGLTETEESFATALTAKARRRRRRRRLVTGAAFGVLLAVLGVVGTLWQRALAETRRAESSKLYTLAQNTKNLPNALAYTRAALELSDQPEYRSLARNILATAPAAWKLPPPPPPSSRAVSASWVRTSPDGKWLGVGWRRGGWVQLFDLAGGQPRVWRAHGGDFTAVEFCDDSRRLVTAGGDSAQVWSLPDARRLAAWALGARFGNHSRLLSRGDRIIAVLPDPAPDRPVVIKSWALDGGDERVLGPIAGYEGTIEDCARIDVDAGGELAVVPMGSELFLFELAGLRDGPVRLIGRHDQRIAGAGFAPDGRRVVSFGVDGEVRLWSLSARDAGPLLALSAGEGMLEASFDATGSLLAVPAEGKGVWLWDLRSPGAAPVVLNEGGGQRSACFTTDGKWLITNGGSALAWPLTQARRLLIPGELQGPASFATDGSWIVGALRVGEVALWPLSEEGVGSPRALLRAEQRTFVMLDMDDGNRYVFAWAAAGTGSGDTVFRIRVADGEVRSLPGRLWAVDATGRWSASTGEASTGTPAMLYDWEAGRVTSLVLPGQVFQVVLGFDAGGRVLSCSENDELLAVDPVTMERRVLRRGVAMSTFLSLRPGIAGVLWVNRDRQSLLMRDPDGVFSRSAIDGSWSRRSGLHERDGGVSDLTLADSLFALTHPGGMFGVVPFAGRPARRFSAGLNSGGRAEIDPRGRWILVSGGSAGAVLVPMPEGAPEGELSRREFLRRLDALTNLRARKIERGETGYAVDGAGVPDWAHPPLWQPAVPSAGR